MAAFDTDWMERWQALVNQDSVTKIIGRHLTTDILLAFGDTAYVVSFVGGTIPKVSANIGPESTSRLLCVVPRKPGQNLSSLSLRPCIMISGQWPIRFTDACRLKAMSKSCGRTCGPLPGRLI